ncbi:MAG: acetyl-coenzyme A synthetase N-terminal domain-containing protein, partial [Gammaproteobacteria bacterium]
MSDDKTYPVPTEVAQAAHIDAATYDAMYKRSIDDADGFWAEKADEFLTWSKKWDQVQDWSYAESDLHVEWFKGGKLNVAVNCVDRHLETRGGQTAIIWEGDE